MTKDGAGTPVTILLVEDNPGDVRLTQEGFKYSKLTNTLHVVGDGIEALDFLFQRNDYADAPRPDIVLLDLNLPRKSGHEVLEELRADPKHRAIPVIVLSGSDSQTDVIKSYNLGVQGYLTKPVDPDEFIDMIRSLEQFWLSIVKLPSGRNPD